MDSYMKIVIGFLLILVGIYVYLSTWFNGFFGREFLVLFKMIIGNLPGLVVFIGLIFLLLGFSDLKNK